MDADDLLDVADRVLWAGSDRLVCWQRAGAFLLRAALECGLGRYWDTIDHHIADCSMTRQLQVLGAYGGREVAASAWEAWRCLSRAAHHHAYDLSPTLTELRAWHERVALLVGRLTPASTDAARVSGPVSLDRMQGCGNVTERD